MGNGPDSTVSDASSVHQESAHSVGYPEVFVGALSGLVGMVAMAPVLGVAYLLDAIELAAFGALADLFALDGNLAVGFLLFVVGGMSVLPLLFITLGNYLPPADSIPKRGVTYATIIWAGFIVAFYTGQSGLTLGLYLALTLVAHWVYGYVLGFVYNRRARVAVYDV